MDVRDSLRGTLDMSSMVLKKYFEDLSDEDLMRRPGPDCNHIAWQLGHLIASSSQLLEAIEPGSGVELPANFVEQHSKEATQVDDPAKFYSKQQYLDLFDKVHAATVSAIEKVSDERLDEPAPERFRKMFPTIGNVFILLATHPMMHAGQFVPVRRAVGKPVVI